VTDMARRKFGKTWWAQRWIQALERFGWSSRLQRGRSYARAGRVLNVEVLPGRVEARVRGTRLTPYRVTIQVPVLTDQQWDRVLDVMANRAAFAAKLLSGEMPEDIEEAFEAAGVHLFPASRAEIITDCSCPDWANPCKHIAATHYILGQEFDHDPFLIFRLRGRTKEQIMDALQERYAGGQVEEGAGLALPDEEPSALDADLAHFWTASDDLRDFFVRVEPPSVPEPMLRRLGRFPDTEDADFVAQALATMYRAVTEKAVALAYRGNGEDHNNQEGSG